MAKVAWDYIVPIKMPKDLDGIEPGKLPASLLRAIPGGGKMHHIASYAWEAMVDRAKKQGVELKPTSSGDTYRDYESQKRGFLSRYQLEPIAGTSTKTFEGKTWYLKKGMAMLATPGKSNHNLGLAVDVHSASEPKRLNWLIANVKDFGFSWEVVPSEPWHLRYVCGDNVPAAVLEFAGGALPNVSVVKEETKTKKNTENDEIKKLQEALKAKGFFKGEVTGEASKETDDAVKAFKVANKLKEDAIVGPKVKELLGLK